jgi:DNA-binding CsgD family transcriptional regulator
MTYPSIAARPSCAFSDAPNLSPTQREIVRRFALGHTSRTIARDLHMNRNTLYVHRTAALARNDCADMFALWRRLGWMQVPE